MKNHKNIFFMAQVHVCKYLLKTFPYLTHKYRLIWLTFNAEQLPFK